MTLPFHIIAVLPFLPSIIFLMIFSSYSDLKEGKIKNKYLVISLILCILTWVCLLYFGKVKLTDLTNTLILGAFGFLVGFIVWFLGFWSAGDAKLFGCFTFLLPITIYEQNGFPLIHLTINTIMPIVFILIINVLLTTSWNEKYILLKNVFGIERLIDTLLIVFGLGWITQITLGVLRNNAILFIPPGLLTNIIGIMILSKIIRKVLVINSLKKFGIKAINVFIAICIVRIIFNFEQMLILDFWKTYLFATIMYTLVVIFISDVGKLFIRKIGIMDLKPGMIPVQVIIKAKESGKRFVHYTRLKLRDIDISKMNSKLLIYEVRPEGFSEKDLEKIRKLFLQKKLTFKRLMVQETVPFAPIISIGVLLTIAFGGNFITAILGFI